MMKSKTKPTSDAKSALRNSTASITGQFANLAVNLISSIYIARMLDRQQFGMYSWALSVSTIAMAIASAGLDNVLIRDVARDRNKCRAYLPNALVLKIIASAICYLGIVGYFHLRGYSGLQLAIGYVLCSIVLSDSLNTSCRSILVAYERQDITATISVVTNAIRVIIVVLLVRMGCNILAVAWVTVAVSTATLFSHLAYIIRIVQLEWRPRVEIMRHLLVIGRTFLISDLFLKTFDRADYIMLDYFKGVEAVGIYSVAYRIIDIVTMIGYSCSLALFPIMSKRSVGDDKAFARAVQKATKYLVAFGTPLCVAIALLGPQLVVALFSSKYALSGLCLSLLIWSRIASFAILPGQQAVAARNAQLWLFPPVVARTLVNISLNIYLIPRYSYIGACWSMIITENVYFLLNYLIAFRGSERFDPVKDFGRIILSTIVMAAFIMALRRFTLILPIIAGIVSYLAAVILLKVFDSSDKEMAKGLLRRAC